MTSANLEGKVAVVTGSTRGIGRAIADVLAIQGAEVIVTGRSKDDVARVVEELTGSGLAARGTTCDVRSYDEVTALM